MLSCQPGGAFDDKMNEVPGCLVDAFEVKAAGIYWKLGERITEQAQMPGKGQMFGQFWVPKSSGFHLGSYSNAPSISQKNP